MGWKGNLRTIGATIRKIERHHRQVEKLNQIANISEQVEQYNFLTQQLVSYHKTSTENIDWHYFKNLPEPIEPINTQRKFNIAEERLLNYKPNFFIKFLGLEMWRKTQLAKKMSKEREKDEAEFQKNKILYQKNHSDWGKSKTLADGILSGTEDAYLRILDDHQVFSDIKHFNGAVSISFENKTAFINIEIAGESTIPRQSVSQLKSGKASVKEITNSQFYQMYQDHVCSIALRVAREAFAYFSLEIVFINVVTDVLNRATGIYEESPILSLKAPKETLDKMNFQLVDPSEAMKNFIHNMDYKKTEGLLPVKKVA